MVKTSFASLAALTVACAFSAALLGFGAGVFAFRSVHEELGREVLIQAMRSAVYIMLGVVLVFRGGWWGVLAAIAMTLCATTAELLLLPFSFEWAAVNDPAGLCSGVRRHEPPMSGARPGICCWSGSPQPWLRV